MVIFFAGEIIVALDDIVKEIQYYRITTTYRAEMRGSALRRFRDFRGLKTRLSIIKSIKADFPSRFTGIASNHEITKKRCAALNIWIREAAHRVFQKGSTFDKRLVKKFLALNKKFDLDDDDDYDDKIHEEDRISIASSVATTTPPNSKGRTMATPHQTPPRMPEFSTATNNIDTKRLEVALHRTAELGEENAALEAEAIKREIEIDSTIAALYANLAKVTLENQSLSHEKIEFEATNQRLQTENAQIQIKCNELSLAATAAQNELESLRNDFDVRRNKNTIVNLRSEISSLQAEVATLRSFAERNTLEANTREANLVQKIAQVTAERDTLQAEQNQSFQAFCSFTFSDAGQPGGGDRGGTNSSSSFTTLTKREHSTSRLGGFRNIFSSCCNEHEEDRRRQSTRPPVPILNPAPTST
mmetsp:Transcript_15739/g.19228  ORF Transcript_15739/g.19228 Transcript_15739/m.19228 type:complete len:417 (+) Transcript_15739:96-1346(+)